MLAGGVQAVALFSAKVRLFVRGRKRLFARLRQAIPPGTPVIWFHCASLGEFEQGRPVMEAYRRQYPQDKILLTFFSPSGYEVRKNYEGADWVFYLPVDTPRNARRFLDIVQPRKAVFIKYEFWCNYLRRLQQQAVPTYIVSAIFRPQQVFFKWYGGFFRSMLRVYRYLFVQDESSVALLQQIHINNVVLVGDTRFDRVWAHTRHPAHLPAVAAFAGGHLTLVAGSTWPSDEERLCRALEQLPDNVRLIIAPHEIHEEHLASIEHRFEKFGTVRYTKAVESGEWRVESDNTTINSQPSMNDAASASLITHHSSLIANNSPLSTLHSPKVLLIDTMGMLLSIYSYGRVAYVGGGFDAHNGVHNTLEPAAYGLPVIFGPVYKAYAEACGLVANGGGVSVNNTGELTAALQSLLLNDEAQRHAGQISAQFVGRSRGATEKVMELI